MLLELKLNVDQVNFIMTALGEMPTKTGSGQLMAEITRQVLPQLPNEEENQEEETS